MPLGERFQRSITFINKLWWIICVPIILDLTQLFAYQRIFNEEYSPHRNIFTIKIGIISAPPSIDFLLEDFPSPIFQLNNSGLKGIIYEFSLFNVFLMLTLILLNSFISSGYFSIISSKEVDNVRIRDFFINGNKKWFKFFMLNIIEFVPIVLGIIKKELLFLAIINIIFMYVDYVIATEDLGLIDSIKKGISFLCNNIWLTIKMSLYFGMIFSFLSIIIYLLCGFKTVGIAISIIIVAYFGAIVNKSVLETYNSVSKSTE